MSLKDNVMRLRERISAACAASGRAESEIEIVAATKCVPLEIVNELPECGIYTAGENRVQEFVQKYSEHSPLTWHIIGALQTNKVKYVVGKVKLIQSVDRSSLAEEISRLSERKGIITDVLAEINICGEENKSGALPEMAEELAARINSLGGVRLKGIMCVPPVGADGKPYERMHGIFERLKKIFPSINTLSVGMSNDFELAIRNGSTMIRPGRILFGERTYLK